MNASIAAQCKDEPAMKAVRVNGQVTEVKQLKTNLILRWVTITFCLFSVAEILGNLDKFFNFLQISWNFGKTQISAQVIVNEEMNLTLCFRTMAVCSS